MKKDLLEKELQKGMKKFKWKRRILRLQIFFHRQKLNIIQFFAIPESGVLQIKHRINSLTNIIENLEQGLEEDAFFRFYLREN